MRTPDETVGDLYAQTACNAVGARSLLQMMDEFGLESIDPLADPGILLEELGVDQVHAPGPRDRPIDHDDLAMQPQIGPTDDGSKKADR